MIDAVGLQGEGTAAVSPDLTPMPPNRRREDPILGQLLAGVETTRATVASMAGRVSVIEREIGRTRAIWEALRIDDMSTDQKRAFLELADWWVDRRGDSEQKASKLRNAALIGTLLQVVIAVLLAFLTIYSVLHQPTVQVKP